MERDLIIKALECCKQEPKNCPSCPLTRDYSPCSTTMARNALSLINELTNEKYDIELSYNSLKRDNERLHETCTEFERKCVSLQEENERLRAEEKQSQILIKTLHDKLDEGYAKFVDEERANIVREMQTELKKTISALCKGDVSEIHRMIDQIAKEMLEGKNEN